MILPNSRTSNIFSDRLNKMRWASSRVRICPLSSKYISFPDGTLMYWAKREGLTTNKLMATKRILGILITKELVVYM
jgi:hypothetical protein